jgi:hypothetical protein
MHLKVVISNNIALKGTVRCPFFLFNPKRKNMTNNTLSAFNALEAVSLTKEQVTSVGQYGVPLRALLSNFSCIGGVQSGVAVMNPGSSIQVSVGKKLPFTINWDRLPGEVRAFFGEGEEGKTALKEHLAEKVQALQEQEAVFYYGDTMLAIEVGDFQHVLVRHNKLNQPLHVKSMSGGTVSSYNGENEYTPHVMKMTLDCVLEVDSQWWKLRNDGVKATTCPMDIRFFDAFDAQEELQVEWDILFGIETLKGSLAYVTAYVNANGGGEIDLAKGVVHMMEGDIPLNTTDGPFHQWVKDNTQTLWVEFFMANAEFRSVLAKRDPKAIALDSSEITDYTDLFLVGAVVDGVILREKIEVLAAN